MYLFNGSVFHFLLTKYTFCQVRFRVFIYLFHLKFLYYGENGNNIYILLSIDN